MRKTYQCPLMGVYEIEMAGMFLFKVSPPDYLKTSSD